MALKDIYWAGGSREELKKLPDDVRRVFGYALSLAQKGERHPNAQTMKGFTGGVVEIIEDFGGDTYRVVYTTKIKNVIVVLHAFQKNSKKGIATPQADIDLIKRRLQEALK